MMQPLSLPVTRLQLRHFLMPLLAIVVAIVMALLAHQTTNNAATPDVSVHSVQVIISAGGLLLSVLWLLFSWIPGNGSQRDIILPWATVVLLVTTGTIMNGFGAALHTVDWHAVKTLVLVATPFALGLTLLTRLYAPTDLCSSSSAIGFCSGCFAVLALTPLITAPNIASALVLCGLLIGTSMAICRLTLCYFIKW